METAPLEIHKPLTYPEVGPKESYLLHHEEIESLVKNYPTIKRARFWMTFGQQYLTYLDCIQNLGMSRIDEITYEAPLADNPSEKVKVKIVPLQFLKAVLPNPQDRLLSAVASVASRTARSRPTTSTTTARTRLPTRRPACRA